MWKYFFAYQTDLPPGSGFDPFSPQHLSWIIPALGAIILLVVIYRKQNKPVRRKMQYAFAITIAMTYILRWIWVVAIGHFQGSEMLPLQLSAVTSLINIAAVFSGKTLFKNFSYACGLPGGIVVFLTPGIGPYPVLHFYYLLFIVEHSLLILFPLIWIVGDKFRPDYRWLLPCFGMVLALTGIDILVNRWMGANYMFLSYVPENTFWKPLADWFGKYRYQFAMAGLLLFVWAILYIPWIIADRRRKS
jgi:hypothetical integral membrane protein (TIGR02206 family)